MKTKEEILDYHSEFQFTDEYKNYSHKTDISAMQQFSDQTNKGLSDRLEEATKIIKDMDRAIKYPFPLAPKEYDDITETLDKAKSFIEKQEDTCTEDKHIPGCKCPGKNECNEKRIVEF